MKGVKIKLPLAAGLFIGGFVVVIADIGTGLRYLGFALMAAGILVGAVNLESIVVFWRRTRRRR